MGVALNTAHPLYANLSSLVGVEDDGVTLKDFKAPSRTFTIHAACAFGSGAKGRHLRTVSDSNTAKGVAYSPAVALNPHDQPRTVFVVTNNILNKSAGGANQPTLVYQVGSSYSCVPILNPTGNTAGVASNSGGIVKTYGAANVLNNGAHTFAVSASAGGLVSGRLYVDGVLEVVSPEFSQSNGSGGYQGFGGGGGFNSVGADFVWVAIFDRVLTDQEISDLHTSVSANNAFALVQAPASDLSGAAGASALASAALSGGSAPLGGAATSAATGAAELTTLSLLSGAALAQGAASASLSLSEQALAGAADGVAVASADLSASGPLEPPAITSEPLANNTGLVLASRAGIGVRVYAAATGAAVAMRSGLATNAAGVLALGDAALEAGVEYHVIVVMADGATGFFSAVAA